MSTTTRPLRGIEQALLITDTFGPFNVVGVLRIHPAPAPEVVQQALEQLQACQPLLRARITSEGGEPRFEMSAPTAALTVVEGHSNDLWQQTAERELNTRIDIRVGPLFRCTYLINPSGETADILLTLHHTIVDAASGLRLFHDLLERIADSGTGYVANDSLPDAGVDCFPNKYRGARFAAAAAPFMTRQLGDEMRFRWQARGERTAPTQPNAQARILPVQLPPSLTDGVIRFSRKQRVTVNSLLTAAMMLAFKRQLYGAGDASIRHVTFADLRPYLEPPIEDDTLGCYIAMSRFTTRISRYQDFAALTHKVHDEMLASNRRGEKFITHVFSTQLMKMVTSLKAFRMGMTALSYTGPTKLEPRYGNIEVDALHAFVGNITLGPEFAALSRLYQGQIWLDISYLDSDMSAEQAAAIANEMLAILEAAAS